MKKYLFFLLGFIWPAGSYAQAGKVLLAVFAHADDEETISPVLAKYAAQGVTIYVAIATDGRLGVSKHAGIPAGDSLVAVRMKEMQSAAAQLGIQPPLFIGMHDQLRMTEGGAALEGEIDTIRNTVKKLFTTLQPDVIITWGPSGWTGHADHRLVGDIVTEVFESRLWQKPTRLYFAGLPAESNTYPSWLATVDPSYLTVHVPVNKTDLDKAHQAWLCHKSQYTPDVVTVLEKWWWHPELTTGFAYFRAYQPANSIEYSLFPGQ